MSYLTNPYRYAVAPGIWYGDRGVFAGGTSASGVTDVLDYINITSTGNASPFGDLLTTQNWLGATGVSNGSRLCWGGGNTPLGDVIQFITVSTLGDAETFGDMTVSRSGTAGVSNGSRGVLIGGHLGAPTYTGTKVSDFITIDTEGDATTFGDATVTKQNNGSSTNGTRGISYGASSNSDAIDYLTIDTLASFEDFGNLTLSRKQTAGCGNGTRGLCAGGDT